MSFHLSLAGQWFIESLIITGEPATKCSSKNPSNESLHFFPTVLLERDLAGNDLTACVEIQEKGEWHISVCESIKLSKKRKMSTLNFQIAPP